MEYITLHLISDSEVPDISIKGLKTFIKPLVKKWYSIIAEEVDITIRLSGSDWIIDFIPLINSERINIPYQLFKYINLGIYLGLTFISDDNLVPYLINSLNENFPLGSIIKIDGMYALKNNYVKDWLSVIQSGISKLHQEGFMCFTSINSDMMWAYLELAYFWNAEIKRVENHVIVRNTLNFSMTPESWYHLNAKRITNGQVPKYRFQLPLRNIILDVLHQGIPKVDVPPQLDVEDGTGTGPGVRIKLKYLSIINYNLLINRFPELAEFINFIQVYPDLSIEANFYSYQQVQSFVSLFDTDLEILHFKQVDPEQGLVLRYQIQEENGTSLLVNLDDNYYLVSENEITEPEYIEPEYTESEYIIIKNELKLQLDIPSDNLTDSIPASSYLGYTDVLNQFTGNTIIQGLPSKSHLIEQKIDNVKLTRFPVQGDNINIITVSAEIPNSNFLISNKNVDYMTNTEILNYILELSLLDTFEILKTESETQILYEGMVIPDEEIKNMWIQGKFMTPWSKYIYNTTKKFSRVSMLYFHDEA